MIVRRQTWIHALLAAFVLAVVGVMFANLTTIITQTQPRSLSADQPDESIEPTAEPFPWRIPLTMALMGFAFVIAGEVATSIWRKPVVVAPPKISNEAQTEALLQQLLKDADANSRSLTDTPLPVQSRTTHV